MRQSTRNILSMDELTVDTIYQTYTNGRANNTVLNGVSFSVEKNQFVTIIGPSGCGKTTLLNIIAGFLKPDRGTVRVEEKIVTGPGPDRSFVFQGYALFPWMKVKDNILFPMKLQKIPSGERSRLLDELLKIAHLDGKEHLYPHQLSGGMKQRTGVIRALACRPRVLLMDEPLGAVDMQMRHKLQEDLEEIFVRDTVTVIMITHDIEEAVFLSDRVLVMSQRQGNIEADIAIDLPHPRDRRNEQYRNYVLEVTDILQNTYQERRLIDGIHDLNGSSIPALNQSGVA